VTSAQKIAPVVCVQNQYNLVYRQNDALVDHLAAGGSPMPRSSHWAVSARSSRMGSPGSLHALKPARQVALGVDAGAFAQFAPRPGHGEHRAFD